MFERFGKTIDRLVQDIGTASAAHRIEPKAEPVRAAYPEGECPQLKLDLNVGKVALYPGTDQLVDGTVTYNVAEWSPSISTDGQLVTVKQGIGMHILGAWNEMRNEWNLGLGTTKPFELLLNKGAGESQLSLGGVPLAAARIEIGAGKSSLYFDKPNPTRCSAVKVDLGAGSLYAQGLLNANTEQFIFSGGVGELTLDFTGEALQRPLAVSVSTGAGKINVNLKHGLACQVTLNRNRFLGKVHTDSNFRETQVNVFELGDYRSVSGPSIKIQIDTLVGDVVLSEIG